ncbi:Hybrid peroxiredoxin hyPrx5 [invertebrate metagenome]|uniref:Hybrid peroxiredoxin hyPrx5 n=1 Tax=invertebrate metagenome TaxID=1711999 RepID=A0A2H9T5D0_9ZZZZ
MYSSHEGQKAPSVQFKLRQNDEWVSVVSDELFADKTVIVFGLPGAYTPTCSSMHLPRYDELYNTFRQQGIDEIYCLAVNDTFVMNSWARDENVKHVKMLPDGNGEFTEQMGLIFDAQELGFGKRTWRYSMLIKNGVIEKQFIEPVEPGDPYKVSDADTMLRYVAPNAQLSESVALFTKPGCPYCAKAKQMLHDHQIDFEEIILGTDATTVSLRAISGRHTVPQIFVGGKIIGGSEQLEQWLKQRH